MPYAYETEKTLVGLFFAQVEKYKNDMFLWSKLRDGVPTEKWVGLTWNDVAKEVTSMGAGMIEMGLRKGDRVAIFSHSRPRWVISDLAIQGAGGMGVPIYPTSTDKQLAYILNDCKAKVVITGDGHLMDQALRVKPEVPSLDLIVCLSPVEDPQHPSVVDYDALLKKGRESSKAAQEFDKRRKALTGDDVAAIIYTSGTTGEPKGAVLTQLNFMFQNEVLLDTIITRKIMERGVRMTSLCHLPLCHIYGRTSDYHVQMAMGGQIYFAESYQSVPQNLLEVRPQMLITIPRLYEKVYEVVQITAAKLKGAPQKIFKWGLEVGHQVTEYMSQGKKMPTSLALKFAAANVLVYSRIKKTAGLDRVVFAGSGGGALTKAINMFFRSMNIQIGEGYGLTETTSAITWNAIDFIEPLPDKWIYRKALDWLIDTMVVAQGQGKSPFLNPIGVIKLTVVSDLLLPKLVMKPGTVGRPAKNTEIKIAEDGEILAKGPQVFQMDKGYFNRPDLTNEAFTDDGYFKTGDIGKFDGDGFLIITDRKKELLVTAGGKNVAPHPIELALTQDMYIEQACVVGDSKKYIAALLIPQFELLEKWAKGNGISFNSREELINHPAVINMYDEKVKKVNENLARYEQIKKFRLLPTAFSEETGELTPTLKMKRRVIHQKFGKEIDSCYKE